MRNETNHDLERDIRVLKGQIASCERALQCLAWDGVPKLSFVAVKNDGASFENVFLRTDAAKIALSETIKLCKRSIGVCETKLAARKLKQNN